MRENPPHILLTNYMMPELRTHVTAKTLLEIGAIAMLETEVNFDPEQLISIETYEQKTTVEDELKIYIENIFPLNSTIKINHN